MASRIEEYDAAILRRDAAHEAVTDMGHKLQGVVHFLKKPLDLIHPNIRRPVEDDGAYRVDDGLDENPGIAIVLANLPTRETILAALARLREAEHAVTTAYDALSDVERRYVNRDDDAAAKRR